MPLSPTISFTITLDTLQGAALGTAGSPASVEIALANYGAVLPRISGTAILAQVLQRIPYVGSAITVTLFGNDVITPVGTYYVISILDDQGNILQSAAYVFNGTISGVDLSTLPQSFPSATSSVQGSEVDVVSTATPTFDCRLVNGPVEFFMVLNQNVTASTLIGNYAGQIVMFRFLQDPTGGWTFNWPSNVKNAGIVSPVNGVETTQAFLIGSDGNAYPLGPQTYS